MTDVPVAELLGTPKPTIPDPPAVTLQQLLPLRDIGWTAFEQLSARLMAQRVELTTAQRYGHAGQAQKGIDILANAEDGSLHLGQSKDYEKVTAGVIKKVIKTFLDADWKGCSRFDFYTTASLADTNVIHEVQTQTKLLADRKPPVQFEAWGRERISEAMKTEAELVVDFFGPYWAQEFVPGLQLKEIKTSPSQSVAELNVGYRHHAPLLSGSVNNVRVGLLVENISGIAAHNVVFEVSQAEWQKAKTPNGTAISAGFPLAFRDEDTTVRKPIRLAPGSSRIVDLCFVRSEELVFLDGKQELHYSEPGRLRLKGTLSWSTEDGSADGSQRFVVDVYRRAPDSDEELHTLKYFVVRLAVD